MLTGKACFTAKLTHWTITFSSKALKKHENQSKYLKNHSKKLQLSLEFWKIFYENLDAKYEAIASLRPTIQILHLCDEKDARITKTEIFLVCLLLSTLKTFCISIHRTLFQWNFSTFHKINTSRIDIF